MNKLLNVFIVVALPLAGCSASLPPPELVEARSAFVAATTGSTGDPGATLAREALERAERNFARRGDTPGTRALAYVATRKAAIAQSADRIAQAHRAISASNAEVAHIEADKLRAGVRGPKDTSEALVYTTGAIEREHVASQEALETAAEVVDDLHRLVHVKRDNGGFVATIPAPKLFGGEAVALSGASPELDAVADAIVRACPGATVTIESHADSNSGEVHDVFVAQHRANAIAAYLQAHGIARDHVRAVGVAPKHVMPEAAAYDMHGLDRRIEITVGPR